MASDQHAHICRGCGAVLPCSLGCAGIPFVWCEPCADAWNAAQAPGRGDWWE